jgi:hypothetical protein
MKTAGALDARPDSVLGAVIAASVADICWPLLARTDDHLDVVVHSNQDG